MKKQTIVWTACPNGMVVDPAAGPARLRLSVHVSPRLETDEGLPTPRLSQFPDMLDWPARLAEATFQVQFGSQPAVDAQRVVPENGDSASQLWGSIFGANTYIKPHEFPEVDKTLIHSYPVKNVVAHIKAAYLGLAVNPTETPPKIIPAPGELEATPARPMLNLFDQVAPPAPQQTELNRRLGAPALRSSVRAVANPALQAVAPEQTQVRRQAPQVGAVSLGAGVTQTMTDFYQVKTFHGLVRVQDRVRPELKVRAPVLIPQLDFHGIVSSLGEFPAIMRLLGLVIDLEIPFPSVPANPQWVKVLPSWTSSMATTADVTPRTRCQVTGNSFVALPGPNGGDLQNGFLKLGDEDRFEVGQIDVDGAAMKTIDAAEAVRTGNTGSSTELAVSTVRSAGLWVARVNEAHHLATVVFPRAVALNAAAKQVQSAQILRGRPAAGGGRAVRLPGQQAEPEIDLYAEDLVRGYRVDVLDEADGNWRSLCERIGKYSFVGAARELEFTDEGWVSAAATTSSDEDDDDLYVHEILFRWEGWSLCASRPGKPLPQEGVPETGPQGYGLDTQFAPRPGSLPRLRYGHSYRLRARAVDLAGNGLPPNATDGQVDSDPFRYMRHEPVAAPMVLPRTALDGSPGESLERLVIRSFNDTPAKDTVATDATSERHVIAPRTSEQMAETHGMFDGPSGMRGDAGTYDLIANRDAALPDFADMDTVPLPYLPEPIAAGALIRFTKLRAGGDEARAVRVPYTGNWPDLESFRVIAVERTASASEPRFDAARRLLIVPLEKAEVAEVWLSSYLPPERVEDMAGWSWAVEATVLPVQRAGLQGTQLRVLQRDMVNLDKLRVAAPQISLAATDLQRIEKLNLRTVQGRNWMVTPSRKLTLVHAVQQPLVTPSFEKLTPSRGFGDTFARLSGRVPVDGYSTAKVDIEAAWDEPLDKIGEPEPKIIQGSAHVFEVPVEPEDTTAYLAEPLKLAQLQVQPDARIRAPRVVEPSLDAGPQVALATQGRRHEFGDTKYRRVRYTAVSTSRFREYLPFSDEDIASGATPITRRSEPFELDILSSARPASPKVLYVVPTFGWERSERGGQKVSTRKGGGLRVYLERTWFSSGDGELLGVVLEQPRPANLLALTVPAGSVGVGPYVSQWGQDPIFASQGPTQMLRTQDFPAAVATEENLTLDELPNARVAVAGHKVGYDPERQLWYCDIEISQGPMYFPFVRLALARYQPKSVQTADADVKLSRVLRADFAQILPDRVTTLSVSADRKSLTVTVSGPSQNRSEAGGNQVEVSVESRRPGPEGDLGWVPVNQGTVELNALRAANGNAWRGEVRLPDAEGTYRLVVREYEVFKVDEGLRVRRLVVEGRVAEPEKAGPPVDRRLVYADVIEL